MDAVSPALNAPLAADAPARVAHNVVIGITAFLTLVDLFATQAILPSIAERYHASPAMAGTAVNACTLGMAIAALAVALLSPRIARRTGIIVSLAVLFIPTTLLAFAPTLGVFALLRVAQGLCMATAFTLTLAYLGERNGGGAQPGAFAAYITGNVASNLIGRLVAAAAAGELGLNASFALFAMLNLAGAALAYATIAKPARMPGRAAAAISSLSGLLGHLSDRRLVAAFAIGFCILFAFIGTFTYVNFVLAAPPLAVGRMQIGLVYLVFLPSILTTPQAGLAVTRLGTRGAFSASLLLAALGLPLLLAGSLTLVLTGLVLVGVGTFLAQAIATGFVGKAARGDRGSASGIYLASYFSGGLAGAAVLGQTFELAGWPACVLGVGAALVLAGLLGMALRAD